MNSEEVIDALELTSKLLELHDENPFKVKAYGGAAFRLSKLRYNFEGKTREDIESIQGVGKSISGKIMELVENGTTEDLRNMLDKTPHGVRELLFIRGLGPKKVRQLWHELGIESPGELLYACNENRLVELKGFGQKTQTSIRQSIEFNQASSNKFHYASVEIPLNNLVDTIRKTTGLEASCTGQVLRKCEIIDQAEVLVGGKTPTDIPELAGNLPFPVQFHFCDPEEFAYRLVETSATPAHLEKCGFAGLKRKNFANGKDLYAELGMQNIVPELREGMNEVEYAREKKIPSLIDLKDLRGVLHNHTTYSDGVHSLREMADYCRELGYEYLGVCDHSKTAAYAKGLSIERVLDQQQEIDALNNQYDGFRILKGIESDILSDGSLDYPEEVLQSFDFIVASVHSNLKMTEEKAMQRLITAIENPYTTILGHPTGRLLLARAGYPVDHRKIIDACAANGVCIELNANPYRLDIDWRWIPYCTEKGVKVSINPDAHHREGYHDMYYGVCVARKGMLSAENCLNAMDLEDISDFFLSKKPR
jgi:DNA polymerase (family 10)